MTYLYSIIIYVQMYIADVRLYTVLTVISEICGLLRHIPQFYACKVCVDMVRETQKIFILIK